MINKYEGISNSIFNVLTDVEKNNIYDELISFLEKNRIRDDIEYYTKYELAEESHQKGEKTREHTFKYLKMKLKGDVNKILEISKMAWNDDNSMYNYLKKTTSDFAYFPLLYKIIQSDESYKYFNYRGAKYKRFL